jgi:hypothetical protein
VSWPVERSSTKTESQLTYSRRKLDPISETKKKRNEGVDDPTNLAEQPLTVRFLE